MLNISSLILKHVSPLYAESEIADKLGVSENGF